MASRSGARCEAADSMHFPVSATAHLSPSGSPEAGVDSAEEPITSPHFTKLGPSPDNCVSPAELELGNRSAIMGEEDKDGAESRKEQCKWRLERLLGSNGAGFEVETPRAADSIRTEDFATLFQQMMVNPLTQQDLGYRGTTGEECLMNYKEQTLGCDRLQVLYNQSKHVSPSYSPLTLTGGDSHPSGGIHPIRTEFSKILSHKVERHHLATNARETPDAKGIDCMTNPKCTTPKFTCLVGSGEHAGALKDHDQNSDMDINTETDGPGTTYKASACHSLTPFSDVTFDLSNNHTHPSKSPLRGADIAQCTLRRYSLLDGVSEDTRDPSPVGRLRSNSSSFVSNSVVSPAVTSKMAFEPGPPRSCSRDGLTESQCRLNTTGAQEERGHEGQGVSDAPPQVRCLAGVPVPSFDTVTIDSDLDSVQTDQVREHLHSALTSSAAWCIRVGELSCDQSHLDSYIPGQRPRPGGVPVSGGEASCRTRLIRKSHPTKRGSLRTRGISAYIPLPCDDEDSVNVGPERGGHSTWHASPGQSSGELGTQSCVLLRRRAKQDVGEHFSSVKVADGWQEGAGLDRLPLEGDLCAPRRDCARVEERLEQRRAQLHETELSLNVLLKKKEHSLQELRCVQAAVEQAEREARDLQASLSERRQNPRQDAPPSALEREEAERQLHRAKAELFATQRQARDKVDALQERLEEMQQELDLHVESEQALRGRCSYLEEQLRGRSTRQEGQENQPVPGRSEQTLEAQLQGLQLALEEKVGWAEALERVMAQKELQLMGAKAEIRTMREEQSAKLRETWEQAQREKEQKLELLKSEQASIREQEIQQVRRQAEEAQLKTLREQALTHHQHMEALRGCMQLKDEELKKLVAAQEQRVEELQMEAREMLQQAVQQEQKKWETEKEEIQRQQDLEKEQDRQAVERAKEEAEREQRNVLSQQKQIIQLQRGIQELEAEGWRLRREQTSALTELRRTFMEEQQAELQRLSRHAEKERQREVRQLQKALERAKVDASGLQGVLLECKQTQEEDAAKVEQQHRELALALGVECQRLQEVLGPTEGAVNLQSSPTVAQAVHTVQALGNQLRALISHLRQELDSQRAAAQRLMQDKEHELQRQRDLLAEEKEQTLTSLREHLIQEHMEELSSLKRNWLRSSSHEEGGLIASLRRQLQDKDEELREVQRNMGHWKEQTTARLAHKFEEEMMAELERCKMELLKERRIPRTNVEKYTQLQWWDDEMRFTMKGPAGLRSASSPSLLFSDPCSVPIAPGLGSLKLLKHLRVRVRQLRSESWAHTSTLAHRATAGDLAGSYLETISPALEKNRSYTRMLPS
ncbi:uncharacterized protein si:ch211-102c2.8 isoform X3 [Brienomyrus brachyistius]|uniref:uncharacterized protein si:ch211-102c2.8 isoform X3 n=2 Tax=Brienomyrus brachyistius TaxID=42636 RepID=UPI0020B26388|nr:uncharacterized protein si:ch211-102c2.8 isoform X3 [Brienomyrus brachyistius]